MMRVLVRGSTCTVPRLRQHALREQRLHFLGARVAERPRQHLQVAGQRLFVGEFPALRLFVGERGSGAIRTTVPSTM